MKIRTLMEDNISGENLCAEHGLCIYVETKKHKLLVDTGQTDRTWDNAKTKGINLEEIDTIVLSHGHYDHSGGLMSFAQINPTAKIYMRTNAGGDYFSAKGQMHYIGIDKRIEELPNLTLIDKDMEIDSELSVFTGVTGRHLWPAGNKILLKKENDEFIQDDFSHEQYLVIKDDDSKYVLISGCAHNGILNILEKFRSIYHCNPKLVISGFHMIRREYHEADINEIKSVAEELKKMDTTFYTGHCTGEQAYDILKNIMGNKLQPLTDLY